MREYAAFHRPTTALNICLDYVSDKTFPLHSIDRKKLDQWKQNSFLTFQQIVADKTALEMVFQEPHWEISANHPPTNTWFGEALFCEQSPPKLIVYQHSMTSRLPSLSLFLTSPAKVV